jgi:hypothetical protein
MAKLQDVGSEFTRRVFERDLWQHRYNALAGMVHTLHETVDGHEPIGQICKETRKETFVALLGNLETFAKAQFDFLYNGLGAQLGNDSGVKPPPAYLEPSLEYPADFVLEGTLDQIAFDLTVLQGAWYQRVLSETNQAMCTTLEIADRLAYAALQPALDHGLLPFEKDKVTVLTYFQKAPHIRMIPYASVALVGIPFTTIGEYKTGRITEVGNARDLLAIPHEIGHYVYRHGSATESRLQHALQAALLGQPEWLHNWAEEIFADVYGVLIAGPVMVRDFQDIMKDNDLTSLLNGDSAHPMPVLRPLIYAYALELLAGKAGGSHQQVLQDLAEEARKRWNDYRGSRGETQVKDRLEPIEQAITTTFGIVTKNQRVTIDDLWSLPDLNVSVARDKRYDKLYEDFYEVVTAKRGSLSKPPELSESWATPLDKLPTLQWLEKIRNDAAAGNAPPGRFPTEVWTLVVSMNGWATNGPEESPSPKII